LKIEKNENKKITWKIVNRLIKTVAKSELRESGGKMFNGKVPPRAQFQRAKREGKVVQGLHELAPEREVCKGGGEGDGELEFVPQGELGERRWEVVNWHVKCVTWEINVSTYVIYNKKSADIEQGKRDEGRGRVMGSWNLFPWVGLVREGSGL
jgi:hypothetical protein